MKRALGYAVNSSDLQQETWNCAIDKIHSLGLCKGFGSDMVRFIDGLQPAAYKNLVYNLAKSAMKQKISRSMSIKLARMAVMEKVLPHCLTCHGAKEVLAGELIITCPKCHGIGVRHYKDTDRAIFMELSLSTYQAHWIRRFDMVVRLLDTNYLDTLRTTRFLLTDYND